PCLLHGDCRLLTRLIAVDSKAYATPATASMALMEIRSSAADLKFLYRLRQTHCRNFKSKSGTRIICLLAELRRGDEVEADRHQPAKERLRDNEMHERGRPDAGDGQRQRWDAGKASENPVGCTGRDRRAPPRLQCLKTCGQYRCDSAPQAGEKEKAGEHDRDGVNRMTEEQHEAL